MTDKQIREVFQITSDPNNVSVEYSVLPLHDDVNAKYTKEDIDSILLTQLTENESLQKPFAYLNDCMKRCQQQKKFNTKNNELTDVFQEIDRLVIGYGLVAFQVQDFAINGSFKQYIIDIVNEFDQYSNFLLQMIHRAVIEDSLLDLLNSVFPILIDYIINDLPSFDLTSPKIYNNVLSIFEMFVNFKQVAAIFTKVEGFFPSFDCPANRFEKVTTLGPILTLSPLMFNVASNNYGGSLELSKQHINMVHDSSQVEHKAVLDRLFFILDKIIRGSVDSRTDVISYWSMIVNKNHLRRGEHGEQNKLATNSFMTNISLLLIRFSQPFLDITYKKIDKIDVNYFNNISVFIDLTNETRLNSDFKEADEFYDQNKSDQDCKPNFISDCFFLSLTYLHYGIGGTLLYDDKISPQIKRLKEELARLNEALNDNSSRSILFNNAFVKSQVTRLEKSLQYMSCLKNAMKGFFTNRTLQLEIFDFVCGASTFLMRVIDPTHSYPFAPLNLPLIPDQVGIENVDNADFLRKHAPVPFKYYPEFCVEGPINYALYISKYGASPLFRNQRLNSFIEFATAILRCPELVSNPHLKGKIVQLLSIGCMPLVDDSPGFMLEIFEDNELVSKNLLYALLDFYVIVEKTGSSSQFYDKFNSRYSISIILEELYERVPSYKQQLIWQSKNNKEFFIRFIARMLNDLTFLLDEGLSSLAEVHNINRRLKNEDPNHTNNDNPNDGSESNSIQDLQSRLASAQRQAKSSCGLASKSMQLFVIFTKNIPGAFVIPELVDRLACMLDYNLESLVGPKCGELKVEDPDQYSFNPKNLLKAVTTTFINLSDEEEFINAVARDGRSFDKKYFVRATDILGNRTGMVSVEFCEKLIKFTDVVQKKRDIEAEEDMEYDDAPDEFLDPLMYTLMKDPVTLPASKVNIDRSTIRAHLLSDSTDPFNRMPLKFEDVIPNEELKKKILDFKLKKKQEREAK
ncbi:Ubiquitin conjugation factor E4 [Monosporozyma unispora]|nr:Ubiquitin conjugation factor E4 [Kazachstania unispora]